MRLRRTPEDESRGDVFSYEAVCHPELFRRRGRQISGMTWCLRQIVILSDSERSVPPCRNLLSPEAAVGFAPAAPGHGSFAPLRMTHGRDDTWLSPSSLPASVGAFIVRAHVIESGSEGSPRHRGDREAQRPVCLGRRDETPPSRSALRFSKRFAR
jgi:hypothetical protein